MSGRRRRAAGQASNAHPGRRNLRAVWLSLFSTAMGLMALLPVLALYVEERFELDDPAEAGGWASLIYGAGPFAAACMGPLWGAMGDRYGKKRMAVRANLAIAASMALMPLAPTPGWLLALRILQGAFAGYVAPSMSLVTAHMPRHLHGRVLARLQVAMALGMFVGPYVGAELSSWFGRRALFWFASVLSLLAALRVWFAAVEVTRPDDEAAVAARPSFLAGFVGGCRELLGQRVFATLLLLLVVLRLGQNMMEPLLALFVRELGPQQLLLSLGGGPEVALDRTIAVAFGVLAIGQWFCTPWWGRMADRSGPLRCLIGLAFGVAVLQASLALVVTIDQFLLLRAALACVMAGSMTLAFSAVSKRVDDSRRTLAFALVQSCIQFGLAFGPQVGVLVARRGDGLQFSTAFAAAALLCSIAGAGMVWLRRVERRSAGLKDVPPRCVP